MKRKSIRFIILVTTVSLLGLVVMQSFWMFKAMQMEEAQFGHRVDMALEDILNELVEYQDSTTLNLIGLDQTGKHDNQVFDAVDTTLLDTLISKYFDYHMLGENYIFQIVKTSNDSVYYSSEPVPQGYQQKQYRACLSCIWKEEYFHLAVLFPEQQKQIFVELGGWLLFSALFLLTVFVSFIYTITTIIKQKKLSEMKNDFINNMTHEFKTPLSTVSLASEVLLNGNSSNSVERVKKYAGVIYDENLRLQNQVERVLQIAQVERDELNLSITLINMHELIKSSVHNLCLENCEKEVAISYEFNATRYTINGDKLHLTNVITNLVDNAIKYSGSNPEIVIATRSTNTGIEIDIKDNGVGMTPETQKQIFDKFYRLPTGNLHNVKGFGLGLYYVKSMLEAHNGSIHVKSEINKGSTFTLFFPFMLN
jgi:two-component system phosphate regulon sensor histidine kinase PhoR